LRQNYHWKTKRGEESVGTMSETLGTG